MTTGTAFEPDASTFRPATADFGEAFAGVGRNSASFSAPGETRPGAGGRGWPRAGQIAPRWLGAGLLCFQAAAMLVAAQLAASLRLAEPLIRPGILPLLGAGDAGPTVPLASCLGLAGALGFALGLRRAWAIAMAAQILVLLAGLSAYFADRPGAVYPLLLSTIGLVLYLNSDRVRRDLEGLTASPTGEPTRDR